MPFTVSHIAAVLPLRRYTPYPLSFTALVAGSMVPDFEYFVRMTLYGHYGHTFAGIFLFDFPMGIILYLLYQGIIQVQLINHLPPFFYTRLKHTLILNWKAYTISRASFILLSLLIGILTHFIWDGFTHDDEYQVARFIPLLLHTIPIGGLVVPVHFVLQMLSSIFGLAILVIWVSTLPPQPGSPQPLRKRMKFWGAVFTGTLIIGLIRYLAGIPNEKLFFQFIVISISAFLFSILLVCVLTKFIFK